jgi:hypothetical protein
MLPNLKGTGYFALAEQIKRTGHAVKLGNHTVAQQVNKGSDEAPIIEITYHGNTIARLGSRGIAITNDGWHKTFTRARLDIIARDNGLDLKFGQKDYAQTVTIKGERVPFLDCIIYHREEDRFSQTEKLSYSLAGF